MAQTEVGHQIGGVEIDLRRQTASFIHLQQSLDSIARRPHPRANTPQQLAIRLANIADTSDEFGTGDLERQLVAQRIDLIEIEIGGRPPRQPARAPRHVRRDMWISVAVTADRRPEAQRRGIDRQAAAGADAERTIQHPRKARHRIPQTLLEDDETAAHLVDRRGTLLADLARRPCTLDLAAEHGQQLLALDERQIGPVSCGQCPGDAIVFLDDAPARDLGRVGGQDELDLQCADRFVQALR